MADRLTTAPGTKRNGPMSFDVVVVGAGIVGLATAYRIMELRPYLNVAVIEQEDRIGLHQTSHNSGVIHAGIYYAPGTAKAELCHAGREQLLEYCLRKGIPVRRLGKLIVAVTPDELGRLAAIKDRALANRVPDLQAVGAERIREIEPEVVGLQGLWSPHTAVVDFYRVATSLSNDLRNAGCTILTSTKVRSIRQDGKCVVVGTSKGDLVSRSLVSCAGLWSDRVAKMGSTAGETQGRIVPFRGDFFRLSTATAGQVRGLVYPIPDPRFPFLGVHLTRTIDDDVLAGPNAVLSLSRAGYRRTSFRLSDALETVSYPGFLRLAARNWSFGAHEFWRAWHKSAFAAAIQRFLPNVRAIDLERGPSGVRAQLLSPSGGLVDDFRIIRSHRVVHVINAPSPAATASLAIGASVAAEVLEAADL